MHMQGAAWNFYGLASSYQALECYRARILNSREAIKCKRHMATSQGVRWAVTGMVSAVIALPVFTSMVAGHA
jgi:hypothetical protein